MSHEIRTPLNAIIGFVDILKDNISDDTNKEYLQTIQSSGYHLLGVINDILDFSKIESGKLEVDKVDFNPKKEFQSIIDLFKIKASEQQLDFQYNLSDTIPKALHSDVLRIKQVVYNLLSNSIKFTSQNKKIDLFVEYKDNTLYVEVKDQGVGIDKEKLETIFDAFTQENNSVTRQYGGSGLGLAISKSLIEMLGGDLKVESQKGLGSRFYFTIPIEVVNIKIEENNLNKSSDSYKKESKILVAEDNSANQMFMKVLLKKLGIDNVTIANDGVEAFELSKKEHFDLVFMDENMPNLSGVETTKKIIEYESLHNLKHTPIVALTANALKGEKERFLKAGMDEYLTKPLKKSKLIEILNQFLS